MKVAVIGTGNSGCAHAAKLSERGHEVRLIKTSSVNGGNFSVLQSQKGIYYCNRYLQETTYHFAPISLITTDIQAGISGADVVLVLTQSLQHAKIAQLIGPYLEDNQLVLIIPGNLGSLQFRAASDKNIILAEGESTPYDARIEKPGSVDILFKNVRNAVSFWEKRHQPLLSKIDDLFDSHKYLRTNVIESAMHNPNLVVHTIGSIMSASRIEQMHGEFWMYRESFSPSVWNLVHQLDEEKNAVISCYGGQPLSYLDACKWRNEEDLSIDSHDVFTRYANTGGPKGPKDLQTRFIWEDVPMGLCALEKLAQKAGIATPITSSLITIVSALLQTDFRQTGDSLHAKALQELSYEQLNQLINA